MPANPADGLLHGVIVKMVDGLLTVVVEGRFVMHNVPIKGYTQFDGYLGFVSANGGGVSTTEIVQATLAFPRAPPCP